MDKLQPIDVRRTVFASRDVKQSNVFFRKSKIVNFYRMGTKFCTLIHIVTLIRLAKFRNDQVEITYVSMATNMSHFCDLSCVHNTEAIVPKSSLKMGMVDRSALDKFRKNRTSSFFLLPWKLFVQ